MLGEEFGNERVFGLVFAEGTGEVCGAETSAGDYEGVGRAFVCVGVSELLLALWACELLEEVGEVLRCSWFGRGRSILDRPFCSVRQYSMT